MRKPFLALILLAGLLAPAPAGAYYGDPINTPVFKPGEMVIDRDDLMNLPNSANAAWGRMWTVAQTPIQGFDDPTYWLANQDSQDGVRTLANALYGERQNLWWRRQHVRNVIDELPNAPTDRVLGLARLLPAYIIAADIIEYRDPTFMEWLEDVGEMFIGNHGRWYSVNQTAENTCNNWGAFALLTRVAIAAFLEDEDELVEMAYLMDSYYDRVAYNPEWRGEDGYFQKTSSFQDDWSSYPIPNDDTWACQNTNHLNDPELDFGWVEDLSRYEGPPLTGSGDYVGETLQALSVATLIMDRAGMDVSEYGQDWLMLAANNIDYNTGGFVNLAPINRYVAYIVNDLYNSTPSEEGWIPELPLTAVGRSFDFADWLYG